MDEFDLVRRLNLRSHDEGGLYSEVYSSSTRLENGRSVVDIIYYMLTGDSPIGHFHLNQSEITHLYQLGQSLRYTTISPDGTVDSFVLGSNLHQGDVLAATVRPGWWKASELVTSGDYGLIAEVTTPAFNVAERTIGTRRLLLEIFPDLSRDLLRLAYD